MRRFELSADDAQEEIEAETVNEAKAHARDWVNEGDYGDRKETSWTDCYIQEVCLAEHGTDEDGDAIDCDCDLYDGRITVEIEPEEPECSYAGGHKWKDHESGVQGHGAGVIYTEFCAHCGCGKHVDTWAQRPDTGQQGLASVSYEEHEFDCELKCDCDCGCDELSETTNDNGDRVCETCADGFVDSDGDFICGSTFDGRTCHVCDCKIKWGPIMTGPSGSGSPNHKYGSCDCGDHAWLDEHRGNWGCYSFSREPAEAED